MNGEVIEGEIVYEGVHKSTVNASCNATAIMPEDIYLPLREPDTHKGDYGRTLIIGGSVGLTGAPILSARAATRTGAGLVYVGVPKSIYNITAMKLDEEMPFPLPDKDGQIAGNAASQVLRRAKECDVCLIGPGLGGGGNPHGGENTRRGESEELSELVQSITHLVETPLVLDADGLNAIAGNADILSQALCPLILTPHPGEFVRLGGNLSSQYGNTPSERLRAASEFAVKYNCILVLKGHRTIIALPNGSSYINTTGGPAMAKGGSGDVLAGMITSLIAQRTAGSLDITIVEAVVTAVYLHGLAGDMCSEVFGEYSVTASDIIEMIPNAMKTVIK